MGWFTRKITVKLIDDKSGESLGESKLPPEDLPESFELQTTLHIGEVDWSVVQATPLTRAEYAKTGSLTLRLRRIEKIDPGNILFSLPSICDRLAPLGNGPLTGDECLVVEDDWRQFELASRQFTAECDAEIAAIRHIHEHARAEVGWRECHVRRCPDPPISSTLTLDDINRAFGGELAFRGVGYREANSPIASGYSFRAADGLECYGIEENGRVSVFAIVRELPSSPSAHSADALAKIAQTFDLYLVNWCRCAKASWDNPLFRDLLIG